MSNSRKRLPGSEKLTRPEDINALSKYLGYIKKTQEEHTELDKDNLEVPGRTTGRIPEINNLYDSVLGLDVNKDEISLEESRIGLETAGKDVDGLYDSVIGLDVDKDETSLEESRIGLETASKDVDELYDSVIGLDVDKEVSLENKRLDMKTGAEEINALPDSVLGLENNAPEIQLGDEKLGLEVNSDIELETEKIDISPDSDIDLDNTRLDLEETKEVTLSDSVVDLKDVPEDIELSNQRVDIDPEALKSKLEDTRIDLGDTGEVKELEDTRINIDIPEDNTLDDSKVILEDSREVSLENKRVDISRDEDLELDDTKIGGVGEEKEPDLTNFIDTLFDDRETELENTKLEIEDPGIDNLSKIIIKGPEKSDANLEDTKIDLDVEEISDLEDTKIGIEVEEVTELSDKRLDIDNSAWDIKKLGMELEKAPDDQIYEKALEMASTMGPWGMKVASLISSVLSNDSVDANTASWYDAELKKLLEQMGAMSRFGVDSFAQSGEKAQNLNGENAELEGTRVDRPEDVDSRGGDRDELSRKLKRDGFNLEDKLISRPIGLDENENGVDDREEAIEEVFVSADKPGYVFGQWGTGGKVRNRGYQTIPNSQLPNRGILDALNINNYIRYGAEALFGLWNPKSMAERKIKKILLNESIALLVLAREQLEKLTKSNRERLPGDDMGMIGDLVSGGVSGALSNLKDNAMSAIQNTFDGVDGVDKLNPLNRPRTKMTNNGGVVTWTREVTKGFDKGNNRQDENSLGGNMDWKQLGENLKKNLVKSLIGDLAEDGTREYSFKDNYIVNNATVMTLENLCNLTDPKTIDSVEALMKVLKDNSSCITTPGKFGTIEEGRYSTMTLDTNAYWEVVIEPFCHKAMNGGYSFLPAIEEINVLNQAHFGIKTAYSKWLPLSNFELQKSKLTNKSLGLYDGEIVYPVSSELSNELRITIVDDQYKSWRTYFQKCADVAVYSSEAHELDFYTNVQASPNASIWTKSIEDAQAENLNKGRKYHLTVVDKTKPLVALYKNITFLVKIYIMTPQYATVRRFNLLCVLKDFEETYSGDIDAGGYDLNLSFSIVGENPPSDDLSRFVKAEDKTTLDEMIGDKDKRELLNQTPRKKGGIIKLL